MAKRRKMTNKEKRERAEAKKRLQEEGIIPPNKPRLNRKKYIEDAKKAWNERSGDCYVWDIYLMSAIGIMLGQTEGISCRASQEAVGVAKVLQLALRIHQFEAELRARGEHEYKIADKYEYIMDILEA